MKSDRFIAVTLAALLTIALMPACGVNMSSLNEMTIAPSESGSGDNPFFQPGVDADDDGAVVGIDSAGDAVVDGDDGGGDAAAQTVSGPVEITTDPDTLPSAGGYGESYEVEVKATGGSEDTYDWSASGLPAGLELVQVFGGKRVRIAGELNEVGLHEITITASDPADSSNSDSISYSISVESSLEVVGPLENGPLDSSEFRIEVLEVGNHDFHKGDDGRVEVGSGIGGEEWVKLKLSGGKGPYTWRVISRVDDSFHRINEGTGTGGRQSIHQPKGITNYRYRDSDAPCVTPEELADILAKPDYSEFWPDCSDWMHLTVDQTKLCEKIGCSKDDWPTGPYGSDEYDHAQQCINGFECPEEFGSLSLTEGQQEACQEYRSWKIKKQKEEEYYGKAKYVCKYTRNPTWRLQGLPAPTPPQLNLLGEEVGANLSMTIFRSEGAVSTFVAEMEYDGPLPVNKLKNMVDRRDNIDFMPVEKVVYIVTDSSPTPKMASVEVDFSLIYPNENIEGMKTKLLYRNLNLDWNCGESCNLTLWLLREKPEGDADWADYAESALANVTYDLKVLEEQYPECTGYDPTKEDPLCNVSMEITDLTGNAVTDVGHVALHIYTGQHQEVTPHLIIDDEFEWHYGDMNVEDISLSSKYYHLQYDDDEAGDLMNQDVSKGHSGTYDLSDTLGIDRPNTRGGSFHRRDLIPGPWTF